MQEKHPKVIPATTITTSGTFSAASGKITTPHITNNTKISTNILIKNFIFLPIISSVAIWSAFKGYIPGAVTATKAIKDDDSKYPDTVVISAANPQNNIA